MRNFESSFGFEFQRLALGHPLFCHLSVALHLWVVDIEIHKIFPDKLKIIYLEIVVVRICSKNCQ